MPRKKLKLLPGRENAVVDCFAFQITSGGRPDCKALQDVYCLKEDRPCSFRAIPADVIAARERSARRLVMMEYRG